MSGRKIFCNGTIRWIVALVVLGAALETAVLRKKHAGPIYNGRPLSAYLTRLPYLAKTETGYQQFYLDNIASEWPAANERSAHSRPSITEAEAKEALHALGPECFPMLIDWIGKKETPGEKIIAVAEPALIRMRLNGLLDLRYRTNTRRWQAVSAMIDLNAAGCRIEPIEPQLAALAQHSDAQVREGAETLLRYLEAERSPQLSSQDAPFDF